MIGNPILIFSRVWPLATVWRCFSAARHCAENILRLRSAACNAGYRVTVRVPIPIAFTLIA
jgi:hypothetical protein